MTKVAKAVTNQGRFGKGGGALARPSQITPASRSTDICFILSGKPYTADLLKHSF